MMSEPKVLRIEARERWAHTGYMIERGARYRITVPPGQTWTDRTIVYGPEGGVTGAIQHAAQPLLRFKGTDERPALYFTLCGAIGESLDHAFVIGAGPVEFVADASGELVCFANDVPFAYGNNSGSMSFTVEKLDGGTQP